MMRVQCDCGKKLLVPPGMAGRTARCPACKASLEIPAGTPEPGDVEEGDAAPVPPAGGAKVCARHPEARVTGACLTCRAPICADCRREFGYYCSREHQARLKERGPAAGGMAPQSEEDRRAFHSSAAVAEKVLRNVKWWGSAAAGLLVIILLTRWAFDRGGTVKWEALLPQEYVSLLEAEGDHVRVVMSGGKVLTYDGSGARVGESSLAATEAWSVRCAGETALVRREEGLSLLSLRDGKTLGLYPSAWEWDREGDDPSDSGLVFLRFRQEIPTTPPPPTEPPKDEPKSKDAPHPLGSRFRARAPKKPEIQVKIAESFAAVDLKSGKKLWEQSLDDSEGSLRLLAGEGHVVLVSEPYPSLTGTAAGGTALSVHSAADGKPLWKRTVATGLVTTPRLLPGALLLATREGLEGVRFADGAPAWKLPLKLGDTVRRVRQMGTTSRVTEPALQEMWLEGGSIYLHIGRGLLCVDPAGGKLRWSIDVGGRVNQLVEAAGVLVLSGYTEKKLVEAAKETPVFLGNDVMQEVLGQEFSEAAQAIDFSAGHDPATGRRRWQSVHGGQFLKTEAGLLLCGTHSQMNLLGPKPAQAIERTALRLLDPSDGDVEWEQWIEEGIWKPCVAGRTLFYTTSRGAVPLTGTGGGLTKPVETKLVAIRLD